MTWIDAGPEVSQPGESARPVRHGGRYLAVAFSEGTWYGFADTCTHHQCPLSDGIVDASSIECTCHGSIFDLHTGAVMRGPVTDPIALYLSEVRAGRVRLHIPTS